MKIALTGGHLTPALAVIDELKKKADNEIIFIGRSYAMEGDKSPSAESVVIPNLGVKFYSIQAGRMQRRFSRHTIPALAKVPLGTVQALGILSKEKPDAVMSFGSYVAFPSIFAAWVLGIPTITHEQTLKGGLATKLISRFVKKIAVSWKDSKEFFDKEKVVLTGNPVRKEILNLEKKRTTRPVIYVTGGNQGSHVINEALEDILPTLLEDFEVVHQTGSSETYKDFENIQKKVEELPKRLKNRYIAAKWFNSEEVADIFSRTSLIVSRAGANTVFEVAALCLPAIFIPIPWSSGDEQTKNASVLSELKAALILPQDRLTPRRLLSSIRYVFEHYSEFKKAAKAASKFVATDAAKLLVEEVEKLVQENETNQISEKKSSG